MLGQHSIDSSQAARLSPPRLRAAWLGAFVISLLLVAGRASAQGDDPAAAESRAAPASTAVPTAATPEAGDAGSTGGLVRTAEEPRSGDRRAAAPQEPGGGLFAAIMRGLVVAVGLIVIAVLARAIFVLTRTFVDATNSEPIGVESNWGGFGGASTGWHLTRPLSLLVAMLLLASLLYLTFEAVLRAVDGRDQVGAGGAAAAAEPSDNAATSEADE